MLSLFIYLPLFIITLALMAWAMARAARAVGSPLARFRHGLLVLSLLILGNLVAAALIEAFATPEEKSSDLPPWLLWSCILDLAYAFFVMRTVFKISLKQTLAPFFAQFVPIILMLAISFGLIRPFLVASYHTPSAGMSPTIEPGDRFCSNKWLTPDRWDIVTYYPHADRSDLFCQRIIALPGERLRFTNGDIYINDQKMNAPPAIAGRCTSRTSGPSWARYRDDETITLGPDEYFLFGDNIAQSLDSRNLGPAKADRITGVIDCIYLPFEHARILR